MTVCKAVIKGWWSPRPLCFFQISAGPLSPSADSELCTVTGNVLWEASSKSAVCAGSRAHPTSAGFQKAAQNQSSLQAPEIRDRNIDALCQTAQATSQQCRLWATLSSPCSDNGVNRMNTGNMRNITLAARVTAWPQRKQLQQSQIFPKTHAIGTTYLLLLLWDFSKIEKCPIFGMSVVSEIMKTNPEYTLRHLRFW